MSLLSRLNSKFGRFAVPNLTVLLIVGQVFLYIAQHLTAPQGVNVMEKIHMYPAAVLDGEVWRLVTFMFDSAEHEPHLRVFFLVPVLSDWHDAGDRSGAAFRYNVFLLIGYVASVAAAFALYFWQPALNLPASIVFLYGTVFLAFARLYPDFTLLIMFILPVKIRWLALFSGLRMDGNSYSATG